MGFGLTAIVIPTDNCTVHSDRYWFGAQISFGQAGKIMSPQIMRWVGHLEYENVQQSITHHILLASHQWFWYLEQYCKM